jgi:hypothetical protein
MLLAYSSMGSDNATAAAVKVHCSHALQLLKQAAELAPLSTILQLLQVRHEGYLTDMYFLNYLWLYPDN